ncbi:MAG: 50S ribosomal protein L20 [Parcubacteria group bacterium GW2011_GWB1_44_7]|nr:MAG: 50S ribosomal protein L20 [Parcubacteria group bacterium GW2011_GWB1_44_7]
MARVKKAVNALKTRKNILRQVKGYRFARSKKERAAYEALVHAGAHAFRKNEPLMKHWFMPALTPSATVATKKALSADCGTLKSTLVLPIKFLTVNLSARLKRKTSMLIEKFSPIWRKTIKKHFPALSPPPRKMPTRPNRPSENL